MSNKSQSQSHRKNAYPYLSVDQFIKQSPCPQTYLSQGLEYLNIRLDMKRTPRDTFVRLFKERRSFSQHRNNESLKQRIENSLQRQLRKIPQIKKSHGLNPEKVGIIIDQIMSKENDFNDFSDDLKKERKENQTQKKIANDNSKQDKNISKLTTKELVTNQFVRSKGVLERKNLFQQMLKRCEKLKEIYRYESQLLNIKQLNSKMNIRFYTEPLKIDVKDMNKRQQQINRRKDTQQVYFNRKAYLQINKYKIATQPSLRNNQSKMLQMCKSRQKSILQKGYNSIDKQNIDMLGQNQQIKQKWIKAMNKYRFKHQTSQLTAIHNKIREKDLVGPWDSTEVYTQLKQR